MNQKGFSVIILLISIFVFFVILAVLILAFFNSRYPFIGVTCPKIDNTLPMYGGVEKCGVQKLADDFFVIEATNGKPQVEDSRKRGADKYITMSSDYSEKKDYDTAMRRLNQAWLLDPTDPRIFWGYGVNLARQKKYDESFKMFEQGLNENPPVDQGKAQMLCDYGFTYLDVINFDTEVPLKSDKEKEYVSKASDLFLKGIATDTNNGSCHFFLGLVHMNQTKYLEAWKEIKEAEKVGITIPQKLVDELSSKMPDPNN